MIAPAEPFYVLGAWAEFADCLGVDPDIFFPAVSDMVGLAHAKAICAECAVKVECLQHALDHDERHGVWGGTSARERRRIRLTSKRRVA